MHKSDWGSHVIPPPQSASETQRPAGSRVGSTLQPILAAATIAKNDGRRVI